MHLKLAILCVVATAATIRVTVADNPSSVVHQEDEDITFEDESSFSSRTKRDTSEVSPVAAPVQDEDESLPSPIEAESLTALNRAKRQWFWGTTSDDEDADAEGSTDLGLEEGSGVGPERKWYLRCNLHVLRTYSSQYADRNSRTFQEFASSFNQAVTSLLQNVAGIQSVRLSRVRRSPSQQLEALLDINYSGSSNPEAEIKTILRRAFSSGRIGAFRVDDRNFTIDVSEENCLPDEINCDGSCATRCDGIRECSDGRDEFECTPSNTPPFIPDIVEVDTKATYDSSPSSGGGLSWCTSPLQTVGSQCFFFSEGLDAEQRKARGAALNFCKENGGSLAEPDSLEILKAQYQGRTGERLWVGAKKSRGSSSFVWDIKQENVNASWITTSFFARGDCLQYRSGDGMLHQATCDKKVRFICERPNPNNPVPVPAPTRPRCRSDDQGPNRCEIGSTYACNCDGISECPGGSDERDCDTDYDYDLITTTLRPTTRRPLFPPSRLICRSDREGPFLCLDGRTYYCKCDGNTECPDGEDENIRECGFGCAPGEFSCDNGGKCVPLAKMCDDFQDCIDRTDELDCPSPNVCRTDQFRCNDGRCIENFRRCDYVVDCAGGEDEAQCPCDPPNYECNSGMCIDSEKRCDGTWDCDDGSDELISCQPCSANEFMCNDRSCVPLSQRCDGIEQCPDRSDEADCPSCRPDQFKCNDGLCIPSYSKCNGVRDCRDGSDEEGCPTDSCLDNQFRCGDGTCIENSWKCDNVPDCLDASDEHGCTCGSTEFRCGDGSCIPDYERCDQKYDCTDASDERSCPCRGSDFTCGDGSCVDRSLQCNGYGDCADGSDEVGCMECGSSEFKCKSGECISKWVRCDGQPDCLDSSDEENCPGQRCGSSSFQCSNGECIPETGRCNGRPECTDRSDEANCPERPCSSSEHTCSDGKCVSLNARCDGRSDCFDGSDETGCTAAPPVTCDTSEWQCNDGQCIASGYRCDEYVDCRDQSDERDCQTPTAPPPPPGCSSSEFTCSNGQCVFLSGRCNGQRDCNDGSDEIGCPPTVPPRVECQPWEWNCDDGQCIDSRNRCDGRVDCRDRSDEVDCRPTDNGFLCRNQQVIDSDKECDGNRDCADGSDEHSECGCGFGAWQCRDRSRCISEQSRCDGRIDCPDNSDEDCGPPTPYCNIGEFECKSGRECIPDTSICDGTYDCTDYSDEVGCGGNPNPPQPGNGLNLKTYPTEQSIHESREVVFQCRDEGPARAAVRWVRGGGSPLPPGSTDTRGRLTIPNIQVNHAGSYYCEAQGMPQNTPGRRVVVTLKVTKLTIVTPPPAVVCGVNEATCMSGECVSKSAVCNGVYDCSDGSDEMRCNPLGCEPNEFQCNNKRCVLKTWLCDSDDDCGDNSDEEECPDDEPLDGSCRYNEFTCNSGNQCIPKSFHCDGETDCQDDSDEIGCSKPQVIEPPCRETIVVRGETFTMECRAIGMPMPTIIWRLNWGHVPNTCTMTSEGGKGILTCPNAQVHHQGAYSCEAINSLGSVFAQPDCIVTVTGGPEVCTAPMFNVEATSPGECISCFCFDTSPNPVCHSTEMYISQIPPPRNEEFELVGVNLNQRQGNFEIRDSQYPIRSSFLSSRTQGSVKLNVRDRTSLGGPNDLIIFFSLPESHKGSQLKAYGGYLRYTIEYQSFGSGQQLAGPDVIIRGNGITLMHIHEETFRPNQRNQVDVRFWPGNWYKRVQGRGRQVQPQEPATRKDIMMVLRNMDLLLIRSLYEDSQYIDVTLSEVKLDTATFRDDLQGRAIYVEKCQCPPGYAGDSCEKCSPNYKEVEGPWPIKCVLDVECGPREYGDPANGIPCMPCPCPLTNPSNQFGSCYLDTAGQVTCNCPSCYTGSRCQQCAAGCEGNPNVVGGSCKPANGCNPIGSNSASVDPRTGRCECKKLTTGPKCDTCKRGSFYMNENNQFGCISCFCMGVTNQCRSSNYYREQTTSTFSNSVQGFELVNQYQTTEISESKIFADAGRQELVFRDNQRSPGGQEPYYWKLPQKFLGDKVTSYGGNLTYTLRFEAQDGGQMSRNNAHDVEIYGNDVLLRHSLSGESGLRPGVEETISVPFYEQNWKRQDNNQANREHLLMALADLEYILIKATYTTFTKEVGLKEVRMDYAEERNSGQERAFAVEVCDCPEGHMGLSCEDCSPGFTRGLSGQYLGRCVRCDCNGHSDECHPETGVCNNCRDNTRGLYCDECLPGYAGNPQNGGRCIRNRGPCSCSLRGSVSEQCNRDDTCSCKQNVEGDNCDRCQPGYFHMSELNEEGCLKCWCNGATTQCSSTSYNRTQLPMQLFDNHGFTITNRQRTKNIQTQELRVDLEQNRLTYSGFNQLRDTQTYYWSLPTMFTGNRLTSYGGNLTVTQQFDAERTGAQFADADVIFKSSKGREFIWMNPDRLQARQPKSYSVLLTEKSFTVNQQPASRDEFMEALANVEVILIRATMSAGMRSAYIQELTIDTAVSQETGYRQAVEVEQCRCPQEYTGLSCEQCKSGYYHDGRACKRCPCNGREESCQVDQNDQVICNCIQGWYGRDCGQTAPQTGSPIPTPTVPDPYITVTTGQTATFRCRGQTSGPQSQTSISWSREDNQVLPYGRSRNFLQDRDAILIISQTEVSDGGRYVCTVTDGFQFEQAIATLVVEESVRVSITEPTLTITIGQTATFGCSGRGTAGQRGDVQSVQWRKGDGTPIPSGKYRTRQDGAQTVLVIPQVTRRDEGSYICIVTDSSGSSEKTATLVVEGQGPRPRRPSMVIQEGQRVEYFAGQRDVRISCSAQAFARTPTITWSKERNAPLPRTATQEDGKLIFSILTEADAGTYICTGTSTGGQVSARIVIVVRREGPQPPQPPQPGPITITSLKPEYQPGDTIRLTCSVQLNIPFTVSWSRLDGALPSRASEADGILTMVNVQPADSGVYLCRMVGSGGRIEEQSHRVVIRQIVNLPEVSIQPDRQTINQGTNAELRCVVAGVASPRVSWSKVNEEFGPSVRADGAILRITNAAVSDRGMYVCTAESAGGTAQAAAILEVERREPPVIDIYPEIRQTIVSGASALFQCHLTAGIPSPTVIWARTNGQPLTPNTETLSGGVLRFNQVRGEEEGSYICTASNNAGTTTATATLEIQSLPLITLRSGPSPYRVRVGDRITLECSATGDPAPSVSWNKLQVGLETTIGSRSSTPTSAIYEIKSATRADEGTYQCTARNAAGVSEERVQVQVTENELPGQRPPVYPVTPVGPSYPPRTGGSDVVRAPLGGSFQFRCRSDPGDPNIRFDFRRSDNRPLPDEHTISNGVLAINNIGPEASGEYACVGINQASGSVLFTIYSVLQVSAPPQIRLEPARQVVRPGDTVRLTCSATGDQPITINWSKEQGYMPTSVVINGGELTFRGIETTDAGRYNCEAINSAGTARAMAEVVVNEEPLLTAMQPNPVFYVGQNQELRCEVSGINPNTVSWTRQGSRLPLNAFPRGNILRLSNVKVEDSGRYICSAQTPQGLIQSDVINLTIERQQSVDIRIQKNVERVSIGQDLTLTCYVGGSNKASVQWSRQGSRLPYNARSQGRDLVFNNISPQNGGVYVCSVTTPQGVFEKAYPLTIQSVVIPGTPVVFPGTLVDNGNSQRSVQTRSAQFGSAVMMKCGVTLDPPVSYTWTKKNSEMPLSARIKDEILDLPEVHSEDAGTYICTARNEKMAMDMPTLLVVTGVVPRFDDKSYLTLRTLPDAYLVFDLEISFKPERDTGLILYNSQHKQSIGDFVAFGMKGGFAEFSFNVGSGPTFVMSKEPLELNKWHTVKLSRNRKDGTMVVNGGRPITEHSEGRFQGLDLIEDLYVGGVEDYSRIQRQTGFVDGFRGCISRIVIGNAIVELLREAKQKVGVTSCNSCADKPCENNGVCQEFYSTYGFKCICPTGFSGDQCENTGLGCYPGICGTGRCINKPGGFECFCPYGKVGERCEQDIIIYEPAFGSESYIAYPTPRALRRFSLDLDFKPENLNDGVLMYCAQKESGEGDFTSLALRNQKLEFKFNTGTGTAMLTSDKLTPGEWVKVRANRTDRLGSMRVNDGELQNEESPGLSRGLNLRTPLYIGGVDNQKISMNPDVAVEGGFTGCIRQIRLMDAEVPLADSLVDSANVGQCGGNVVSACASNPCVNNGECNNDPSVPHGYSCKCNTGYSGLNCDAEPGVCSLIQPCQNGGACIGSGESYSCRCPLGFSGRHCSHSTEVKASTSYNGDSWIEFDKNLLPQDSEASQEVELEFSTLESDGVLFWLGQQETVSGRGQDYLSIALVDGRIEFSYELGTGEVKIKSPIRSDDGERHRLKIKRSGKDGTLEIDNNVKEFGQSLGILHMLNVNGNIFVGGLPNIQLMTGDIYESGFQGCIHQIRIGNTKIDDIRVSAVSGINVTPCPRDGVRYSRGSNSSSHSAGQGHNGIRNSHRTHSSHRTGGHSSSHAHPSDKHESNSQMQKHFKNGTHYRTESQWSSKKTVISRHNFK